MAPTWPRACGTWRPSAGWWACEPRPGWCPRMCSTRWAWSARSPAVRRTPPCCWPGCADPIPGCPWPGLTGPAISSTCGRRGCAVTDAAPALSDADDTFQVLRAALMAGMAPLLRAHREQIKATLTWNIEKGIALTGEQIAAARASQAEIFQRVRSFLADGPYDVLALPTAQVVPFPVEQEWVAEIDGEPMATYIDWMRSCSRITVSAHPAISVPAGLTASGLPVGLQLVGRYGADRRLLEIAAAIMALAG